MEEIVEDVMQEVLDVADEVQDVVVLLDIDMSGVPKAPKMSVCKSDSPVPVKFL